MPDNIPKYPAAAVTGAPGVTAKHLGYFNDVGPNIKILDFAEGAQLPSATAQSQQVWDVIDGEISYQGASYARRSLLYVSPHAERGPVTAKKHYQIHRPAPSFVDQSTEPQVLAHQLALLIDGAIVAAMVSRDPGVADTAAIAAGNLFGPSKARKPKRTGSPWSCSSALDRRAPRWQGSSNAFSEFTFSVDILSGMVKTQR